MPNSYRQIFRSSFIIGGASFVNILIGLFRTKIAASLIGPLGIGVIGLFQNLLVAASAIAALGIGAAGTREIAEASSRNSLEAIAITRRALFWGTSLLAAVGAMALWLLRDFLADRVLGDSRLASSVGWLSAGVALNIVSGSQVALLNGYQRIGAIARVSIIAGFVSALLGIAALSLWLDRGIVAFVIASPLASALVGHLYVRRLPPPLSSSSTLLGLLSKWQTLTRMGGGFMIAGSTVAVGQLAVRAVVEQQLGLTALGQFQASWLISMAYVGIVLNAMATDYYPRLTASIADSTVTNRLINEQIKVILLLGGPVFLLVIGLAPTIIQLLYSNEFLDATIVLRWQLLGDILKVTSWPIAFVFLALGDGKLFMLTEALAIATFFSVVAFTIPLIGVKATGVAFFIEYIIYLPVVYFLAWQKTRFMMHADVLVDLITVLMSAIVIFIISQYSQNATVVITITATLALGFYNAKRLIKMIFDTDSSKGLRRIFRGIFGKVS